MPRFFRNKRLIILLVSIIVLVALIGFSLRGDRKLTWPEQFTKDSVGFVQSIVERPAQYVAGFFRNIEDLKNTYDENKVLKARLDEYVSLSVKVNELEKENKDFQETLDTKSIRDYDPLHATVISRDPDGWYDLITIDRGEKDGVQKEMAVITPQGLIGKVKSVSQFTSTVQLLSAIDRTNRISAVIQGDAHIFGLIEGYDKEKKALLFKRIPSDAKIEEKQRVITSGLGGIFPAGLVIGEVMEVVPDDFGLTQTAYVKPAADFFDISHVIVVKRNAPSAGGN